MKTIEAYECEHTGAIFKSPKDAAQCEFRSLMKKTGAVLPSMGQTSPYEVMNWLASNLDSGIYGNARPLLREAIAYLDANYETITGSFTAT